MKLNVIKYEHHGKTVSVQAELKGKHREHCLCYSCIHFNTDPTQNCEIAAAIFANCVKFDVVTPVWECAKFEQKPTE